MIGLSFGLAIAGIGLLVLIIWLGYRWYSSANQAGANSANQAGANSANQAEANSVNQPRGRSMAGNGNRGGYGNEVGFVENAPQF